MKPDSERKFLTMMYWTVVLLGAGFMLYSSYATCGSMLAPEHKYCAD